MKQLDAEEHAYQTKSVPCDFLQEDGNCLLGDHKPDSCKEYPYTDEQNGRSRILIDV